MADAAQTPVDPLAGLIDPPLPPAVSLWPQTWESLLVIAVLVVGASFAIWWALRRARANRYRKAALAELDRIATAPTVGALAVLVRGTALAAFARDKIVALAGPAWLAFLDRSYGGTGFSQGPGRLLADSAYRPAQQGQDEIKPLIDLVRRWIATHHA